MDNKKWLTIEEVHICPFCKVEFYKTNSFWDGNEIWIHRCDCHEIKRESHWLEIKLNSPVLMGVIEEGE